MSLSLDDWIEEEEHVLHEESMLFAENNIPMEYDFESGHSSSSPRIHPTLEEIPESHAPLLQDLEVAESISTSQGPRRETTSQQLESLVLGKSIGSEYLNHNRH